MSNAGTNWAVMALAAQDGDVVLVVSDDGRVIARAETDDRVGELREHDGQGSQLETPRRPGQADVDEHVAHLGRHAAAQRANALLGGCIKGATFTTIEGAAHFMIATHADEVGCLISEHIQCVESEQRVESSSAAHTR